MRGWVRALAIIATGLGAAPTAKAFGPGDVDDFVTLCVETSADREAVLARAAAADLIVEDVSPTASRLASEAGARDRHFGITSRVPAKPPRIMLWDREFLYDRTESCALYMRTGCDLDHAASVEAIGARLGTSAREFGAPSVESGQAPAGMVTTAVWIESEPGGEVPESAGTIVATINPCDARLTLVQYALQVPE